MLITTIKSAVYAARRRPDWFLTILVALWGGALSACGNAEPRPAAVALPSSSTPEIGVTLATAAAPPAATLQLSPTPLPTPSITPSSTPVIYQIVAGDTLLAIAWDHFTTVEEILALNPNVRPELLQIGQTIILPPPATPAAPGELATLAPIQISVVSLRLALTPVGSVWILGEVLNEGDQPVENVQLSLSLLDESGNPVGQYTAWTAPGVVRPQEKAPFGLLAPNPPAGASQVAAAISGGQALVDWGNRYLGLAAEGVTATIEEGRLGLSGRIRNTGDMTARQISLIVTLYDAQGQMVGYHQENLSPAIAPGAALPFALDSAPPGGQPVSYVLQLEGLRSE